MNVTEGELAPRDASPLDARSNRDYFTDPSIVDNPYEYFAGLRSQPVCEEARYGVLLVSGHFEAVEAYFDDRENMSACNVVAGPFAGPILPNEIETAESIARVRMKTPLGRYFASQDPPEHGRHRALLRGLLTPARVAEYEPLIRGIARDLADGLVSSRRLARLCPNLPLRSQRW